MSEGKVNEKKFRNPRKYWDNRPIIHNDYNINFKWRVVVTD